MQEWGTFVKVSHGFRCRLRLSFTGCRDNQRKITKVNIAIAVISSGIYCLNMMMVASNLWNSIDHFRIVHLLIDC